MNKSNQILLILAAGLTLLTWLLRPQIQITEPLVLSRIDPNSISTIELSLGGRPAPVLKIARQTEGWRLLQPVEMPADELAVQEILRLLSSEGRRKLPIKTLDLPKLSLNPPLWRVKLDGELFELGTTEATSGDRYVRIQDAVYLVPDLNAARFDNNYADLVSRKLLPNLQEVVEIRLPDSRHGTRTINLLSPGAGVLFDRWLKAQAQWLLRPSELDFDDVHSRISLFTRDGRSVDFLIHRQTPRLELIRPDLDLMYILPASASQELIPGA